MGYLLKKKLLNVSDKPSFDMLIRNQLKMRCLFDTGADTPVFTLGDDALCKYFPDAQFEKELTYILSGFGKGSEEASVYKIPQFILKSDFDDDYIQFNNLYVASCFRPVLAYPFILSATMFGHMNYMIVNEGNDAKCIKIQHSKLLYNIGIVSSKLDSTKLAKVYSFMEGSCD